MTEFARIDAYLDGIAEQGGLDGRPLLRLNEPEVYDLLDLLGVGRCPAVVLAPGAGLSDREAWAAKAVGLADERGRLLLKVVGREILHKTEAGGVAVVRLEADGGAAQLSDRADRMRGHLAQGGHAEDCEGLMAAAFVPHDANRPGQELLLSLRQDPAFGPCVVVGIGGTLTEWYGHGSAGRSTLVLPAAQLAADTVRAAVIAHPWLRLACTPSRLYAEAPLPLERLVEAVLALARLGVHCGAEGPSRHTLEELEINPAVASGGRLVALDGVGLLSTRKQRQPARPLARIGRLLAPRSAVVLGVSARGANPGRIILDNLLRSAGAVRDNLWVVHPQEETIAGVACVPTVAALPRKCDLAVVSIPAEGALAAISELVEHDKAESIILIPGGFAEAGHTDLAGRIEAVLQAGHARPGGGPVLVGGNCLGIVSRDQYNTFFLPEYKLPFRPGRGDNLAVVSQSGAYLVTFASNYDGRIHPRASISFGNQMDLTVADFLEHFNAQGGIDVVACYVEGFRPGDGARCLAAIAEARRRGRRVVVFKAGKTALGAQAAASHTASLAGDYAVAKACLESAGATVAESLDEFEDLLKTFSLLAGRAPGRRRVGIISNAGFECSTVMDRLEDLELAVFDPAAQAVLDEVLPAFAHRTNPIDCTPMTGTEAFTASCRALLDSPAVDAAILSAVPVTPALDNLPADPQHRHREDLDGPASLASLLIPVLAASAKPLVFVVDSGQMYDPFCRRLEEAGIPVFRKIDRAARALAAYCRS